MDALWVTLAALVTALATGLGALPFAFVGEMSRRWLGASNAIAAGFMLSASGALLIEGAIRGVWRTAAGAAVGAVFIWGTHRALGGHELHLGELRGADALKGVLIVGVMTVHSFAEGVGIGVSYGGGAELGIFITIAIAIHNIPEGLAISLVLVPRGASVPRGRRLEHLLEPAAAARGRCWPSCSSSSSGHCWPPGSASPAAR